MTLLLLLAVALAADAFAVALCQGAAARPGLGGAIRVAIAFGLAQAVMPAFGYGAGSLFDDAIRNVDHWIAFALLAILGLKMAREGLVAEADCAPDALIGMALLAAAVATSIDAAAAGITLPLLGLPMLLACAVIGAVTALLCFGGVLSGARLGVRFGKRAEVLGGLLLVGLGTKILVEHTMFA
jgi:putative Mn2+ efflux pump MntP